RPDHHLRRRRHLGGPVPVGHPPRGVRLRLRAGDAHDAALGPGGRPVSGLGAAAVVLAAFVVMEGVSYAMHGFVMHGPGWAIHRAHHRPPRPGFERNDAYPASFSLVAVGLFAVGTAVPGQQWALWAGIGMTAYGLAYLWAHELCIHQR